MSDQVFSAFVDLMLLDTLERPTGNTLLNDSSVMHKQLRLKSHLNNCLVQFNTVSITNCYFIQN